MGIFEMNGEILTQTLAQGECRSRHAHRFVLKVGMSSAFRFLALLSRSVLNSSLITAVLPRHHPHVDNTTFSPPSYSCTL